MDGKGVAKNKLVRTEPTAEQQAMHTYCTGWPTPHLTGKKAKFSYGNTFTFGDGRIYIRSYESLICIGT